MQVVQTRKSIVSLYEFIHPSIAIQVWSTFGVMVLQLLAKMGLATVRRTTPTKVCASSLSTMSPSQCSSVFDLFVVHVHALDSCTRCDHLSGQVSHVVLLSFVLRHRYLHLTWQNTHGPIQAPESYFNHSVDFKSRMVYYAMVHAVDDGMGSVNGHCRGSAAGNTMHSNNGAVVV